VSTVARARNATPRWAVVPTAALLSVCLVAAPVRADRGEDLERLRRAIAASRERVAAYEREQRDLFETVEALDRAAVLLAREVSAARAEVGRARSELTRVEAEAALLQLAKAGKIDPYNWRAVADALAGATLQLVQSPVSRTTTTVPNPKTYHVRMGNQNSMEIPPPADMPIDQVNQRIQIIDRLLNITSDSQAIARLQAARSQLAARL